MNFGLIVAAGKGERFGSEKQFSLLRKKPVLYYALKPFEESNAINEISLVVAEERTEYVKEEIVKKYDFQKIKNVVAGGAERRDSVSAGLKTLPDSGMVAIHDGVRPFVAQPMITRGFEACKKHKAVIYGLPVSDTVKRVIQDRVGETVDRRALWAIQTPQFFDLVLIKKAYRQADGEKYYATDDSALVEKLGEPVMVLAGDPLNIKITSHQDLMLAEAIWTKWKGLNK